MIYRSANLLGLWSDGTGDPRYARKMIVPQPATVEGAVGEIITTPTGAGSVFFSTTGIPETAMRRNWKFGPFKSVEVGFELFCEPDLDFEYPEIADFQPGVGPFILSFGGTEFAQQEGSQDFTAGDPYRLTRRYDEPEGEAVSIGTINAIREDDEGEEGVPVRANVFLRGTLDYLWYGYRFWSWLAEPVGFDALPMFAMLFQPSLMIQPGYVFNEAGIPYNLPLFTSNWLVTRVEELIEFDLPQVLPIQALDLSQWVHHTSTTLGMEFGADTAANITLGGFSRADEPNYSPMDIGYGRVVFNSGFAPLPEL